MQAYIQKTYYDKDMHGGMTSNFQRSRLVNVYIGNMVSRLLTQIIIIYHLIWFVIYIYNRRLRKLDETTSRTIDIWSCFLDSRFDYI